MSQSAENEHSKIFQRNCCKLKIFWSKVYIKSLNFVDKSQWRKGCWGGMYYFFLEAQISLFLWFKIWKAYGGEPGRRAFQSYVYYFLKPNSWAGIRSSSSTGFFIAGTVAISKMYVQIRGAFLEKNRHTSSNVEK